MVGVGTVGGSPMAGGRVSVLVQWAVVASPEAEVGVREREQRCVKGFGERNFFPLGLKGIA